MIKLLILISLFIFSTVSYSSYNAALCNGYAVNLSKKINEGKRKEAKDLIMSLYLYCEGKNNETSIGKASVSGSNRIKRDSRGVHKAGKGSKSNYGSNRTLRHSYKTVRQSRKKR